MQIDFLLLKFIMLITPAIIIVMIVIPKIALYKLFSIFECLLNKIKCPVKNILITIMNIYENSHQ